MPRPTVQCLLLASGGLSLAAAQADALAAVQRGVSMHTANSRLEEQAMSLSRFGVLRAQLGRAAAGKRAANGTGFNCALQPHLCQAPFNCHLPQPKKASIATLDGQADWSQWCSTPYGVAAAHCASGNLTGYAKWMHGSQLGMKMGPIPAGKIIEGIDAHYCFAFGHCDNTEVKENTTLAEAGAMCDKRFGKGWRTVSQAELHMSLFSWRLGVAGAHLDKSAEQGFAEMACAMGNYHCDTMYCRQEYCHREDLVAKFDSLRPPMVEARKAKKAADAEKRKAERAVLAEKQKAVKAERAALAQKRKAERAAKAAEKKAKS